MVYARLQELNKRDIINSVTVVMQFVRLSK